MIQTQTTNLRILRRISFLEDVARLTVETGQTQRYCFEIYNREFPTFDNYGAFKLFKHRHRNQLKPGHPLSDEISRMFADLIAVDNGRGVDEVAGSHISTRRDIYNDDRAELHRVVAGLLDSVRTQPGFLERILYDYARMIAG
jgi:hypothetical protein